MAPDQTDDQNYIDLGDLSITDVGEEPPSHNDKVREWIAKRLLYIFSGLLIGVFVIFLVQVELLRVAPGSSAEMTVYTSTIDLLQETVIPTVAGIVGTVMGFYFGSQQGKQGA